MAATYSIFTPHAVTASMARRRKNSGTARIVARGDEVIGAQEKLSRAAAPHRRA
jgi:hypothetical protein